MSRLSANVKNGRKSNTSARISACPPCPPPPSFPSLKRDLTNAKLFLQNTSEATGDCLYEHLSRVISKVIDERPFNVVDYFELYSERVRADKSRQKEMPIEIVYKEPERLAAAQYMLPVFIEKYEQQRASESELDTVQSSKSNITEETVPADGDEEDENDEIAIEAPAVNDLCELQFYWNLLGIGFPREETYALSCAFRKLKMNESIFSCRFWGKIFGLKNDYYIAECTLTEDALEKRIDAVEKAINIMNLEGSSAAQSDEQRTSSATVPQPDGSQHESKIENSIENEPSVANSDTNEQSPSADGTDRDKYPTEWNFSMNIPATTYVKPIEIPTEEIGHGINRYVYYVCTNLYDEWIELPSVTPHQINVCRRMKKYLTGNLDEDICSHPAFPGTERNYLRAVIGRISAGSHVAPKSLYMIGSKGKDMDEDEDHEMTEEFDEDGCNNDKPIKLNPSYRPLPLDKLLKLDNWVHIKPEILKQGRICYFDGKSLVKGDAGDHDDLSSIGDDNEDEAEEELTNIEIKPDVPAPLFTSCSGDRLTNDVISPWTITVSDVTVESPLVLLQSNIWTGAFAFVKDRICDNIYIGYGHKYSSLNYSPTVFVPRSEIEYPHGDDVELANDPTVDEEKEHQQKLQDKTGSNRASADKEMTDEVEGDD